MKPWKSIRQTGLFFTLLPPLLPMTTNNETEIQIQPHPHFLQD
jgi:hypothetical protein